ncbi:hypothetical protein ACLOAV_002169 [Pseudogymnoascus australis]
MPALSILNADPPLLAGPALLHNLVDRTSAAASPALDYLGPEGTSARYSYTYSELQRCVASLASQLHSTLISTGRRGNPDTSSSTGSSPQLIIPLLIPQSPALYIAQLAALQVGAAFCPINLDAPKERIKFISGDVKAQLIISTHDNADAVTWDGGPTPILLDAHFPIPPSPAVELPLSQRLPKGVGVSHRAATQSLLAHEALIPRFTRFLQFAAPSFDVSVFEIFFPLARGATLIACHRERLLNDLPGTINLLSVDACELTPTVVGSLLLRRANVPGLKLLLTIGEMLTRPVVDEFGYSDDRPGMLYGMYGPTEAAIHCTAYTNMAAGTKVGNIGRPFSTVSCLIAAIPDPAIPSSAETLTILPLGEIGELVLGGTQLADGYLNREKENRLAFVTYDGAPAYRTGDKGRILEDGTVEVMGRISAGQVKLRGQRVELGEVEEVVYKHRGIELAFASVLEGMLVVFARAAKGEVVVVEEVLETCGRWLSGYMVPSEVVVMTQFPYLPSGKIDKKKLEAEYLRSRAEDGEEGQGGGVGDAEDGCEGGKGAVEASHLRSARLRISPTEILEAETVGEIARVCEERLSLSAGTAADDDVVPEVFDFSVLDAPVRDVLAQMGVHEPFEEVMPCTPLQDAMLLETAVEKGAYNNFLELRVDGGGAAALGTMGDGDPAARVVEALRELAGWNAVLRTGFVEVESEWSGFTQVIWPALDGSQIVVEEGEEGEGGEDGGKGEKERKSLELLIRDLETILSSPSSSATTSTSSSDDNSTTSATTTTTTTTAALTSRRPPFRTLVEHTLRLATRSLEPQKQYWKDHLAHFSPRTLPSFHSTSTVGVVRGLDVVGYTTAISTPALDIAAAKAGVSAQVLVQTAYALVLSGYVGTSDVCFGAVFSGRSVDVEGVEEIAGPCIATLPVRVDVKPQGGVGEVVEEMGRVVRRHMENEGLGLREIQGLVEGEGGLFDTLVVWQRSLADDGGEGDDRKKMVQVVRARDYLEFVLTLEVTPDAGRGGKVRLDANYQTAIFGREMIAVLLKQIEGVVLGMIQGNGLEGGVQDLFGAVEEGVMAVYEGVGEVSPLDGANAAAMEKSPHPRRNGRANQIARLVTANPDAKVSTQLPRAGKVRGCIGRVGKGVRVLVIDPSSADDALALLPLGAEGELCVSASAVEDVEGEGGGAPCLWEASAHGGFGEVEEGGEKVDGEFRILDAKREVVEAIYEALDSEVPSYAVPTSIIPISALPLTAGGDVDTSSLARSYNALPPPQLPQYANPSASTAAYVWTPLESLILAAVTSVAKSPSSAVVIKPTTPFSALGIDSIAAIGLVRRLREGGVRTDVGAVLRFGSVRRLGGVIEEGERERGREREGGKEGMEALPTPEEIVFEPALVDGVPSFLPLPPPPSSSSAGEEEGAYVNRVLLDLKASIEQVEDAWRSMVKRHEILRTCFVRAGHARYAFCQVVLSGFAHESRVVDVADAAGVEGVMRRGVSWQDCGGEAGGVRPPYELTYVRVAGGGVKLVLAMHHALYDGFAMGVLYEEMEMCVAGRQAEMGEAVSFAPFLRYVGAVRAERADAFWRGVVGGFCPVAFSPPPSLEGGAGEKVEATRRQNHVVKISASMSLKSIEERLAHHDASLLSVCQAAWASLLAHRASSTDVCLGSVVSGRTVPVEGLNRLVAPCFNTIPFRLRNLHRLSYLEAFRTLQGQNAEAVPWQMTGLRRVQNLAGVEGGEGGGLFDTLVLVQTAEREMDGAVWSVEEDRGGMDFPVVVEIVPRPGVGAGGVLEVILHTHGLLLDEEGVREVVAEFDGFLEKALREPREQIVPAALKAEWAAKTAERRDRKARATVGSAVDEEAAGRAWTELEITVRGVIAAFTTVPEAEIGRGTSIYRLGLDSINAVQVATSLRGLGHKVAANEVLIHPSIGELAGWIAAKSVHPAMTSTGEAKDFDFKTFDEQHRPRVVEELKALGVQAPVEGVYPCTPVQSGMLAQTLRSGGVEYVNSYTLQLRADVSLERLRDAWGVVVKACPMLRAGFVGTGRGFAVVVFEADAAGIPDLAGRPWWLEVRGGVVKFTAQHALYDAQSLHQIFGDVQAVYSGGAVPSYPSFLPLLGAILTSNEPADEERRRAFWVEQDFAVHRFPDLTPLRVTSTKSIARTATSMMTLGEIEERCRESGVSVQAVGQAAWARLLAAYVGEGKVTFGVTLSGRGVAGGEEVGDVPFPTIVTVPKVMSGIARVGEWQFTPLTDVQRWTGNQGGLFDTLFAYQKSAGDDDKEVSGEEVWKIVEEDAEADFAVSIEMLPEGGDMVLQLTAKECVVPSEQVELMLSQFDALLVDMLTEGSDGIVGRGDEKILSITPPERPTLSDSDEKDMLLHGLVERQARLTPSKVALEFTTTLEAGANTAAWTYAQLDAEANRIAHLVQNLGAVQGQLIAICFDKCPEASFSIVGVMKAGSAYVALDPGAPADRVKFIIQDSGATVVLSAGKPAESLKAIFEGSEIQVVDLGTTELLEGCSTDAPVLARPIDPQDSSYCLYTSGTTGTPKGCELTHENAVQAMFAFQHLFGGHWTPESKWLQFASFHFDVSVLEQFWSWSVGICVASAPRDLIFEDIPGAIRALGITHLDLTPSLARLLHPDEVPALCGGVFITGGEQLRQDILDVWGEHACIYNGYGPTEATIGVTMYPRVPQNGKPANIGPQFLNVGSFVLKPGTSEPVLRGAVGELCVSGKLVGKGYLNRDELTAERFPYLEALGERVYRTGDLVRICHDGSFLFLGRADDQVKLRGQRLELTEITEVIKKGVEGLEEVVTQVLRHSAQLKEQLVAFFVPTADIAEPLGLIGAMRDACTSRLPGYMVPTHFVPLKALPLSANNKADGKALARMYDDLSIEELQRLSTAGQEGRQWTGAEREVLHVLAECMDVPLEELGSGTNIFELGFDSISVIGLAQRLQKAGFGGAKAAVVMGNAGVEGRGEIVAVQQKITAFAHRNLLGAAEELGVDAEEVEALAPCTAAQAGMIYRFLDSEGALYFMNFAFELAEGVDVEKLREAWERVVKGLEVLRMGFVFTPDGCAQVVLKQREVPWGVDAEFVSMEKGEALARPLPILLRKVEEEYMGVEGVEYGPSFMSVLPHGPLAAVEGAEAFWKGVLETAEFTPLPLLENGQDGDVSVTRRVPDLGHLEALRQSLGVTYQAILQAAWISAFRTQFPVSAAPSFGNVISGRAIDFSGAENVVGPLLNTLVFHVDVAEGMTWKDLVQACHAFNVGAMPFQHSALKDVQKWCGGDGRELFDSLFVFQREEEESQEGLWREVEGEAVAGYPLAFEATLMGGGDVTIALVGQGNYVSEEIAKGLLDLVESSLSALKSPEDAIPGVLGSVRESQPAKSASETQTLDTTSDKDFEWTPTASVIRAQISELSKVEETTIAANTTLFSLGLDSIDVIKLASRLKKAGVKISVSAIVKSQTVAKMMGSIQLEQWPVQVGTSIDELERQLRGSLPDEEVKGATAVLPATPLQEGMVAEMMESGFRKYFNHELYRVKESVDMAGLKKAWETVVAEFNILRTSFVGVEDVEIDVGFAQVVHPASTSSIWRAAEISKEADLGVETKQLIEEAVEKAKTGSLLQLVDITHGGERYYLLSISHALYDGWSLQALHANVQKAYNGQALANPSVRLPLEQLLNANGPDATKYWRTALNGLPKSEFPLHNSTSEGVNRFEFASSIPFDDIQAFCRGNNISLQTLGQTAWAILLASCLKRLDVAFGVVLSCRDTEETSELMFPLMNTVVVRAVIHGDRAGMLQYMQESSNAMRAYQHFPLRKAQALAGRQGGALFDTLFIYQGKAQEQSGEVLAEAVESQAEVEFKVCVEMEVVGGELVWMIACREAARTQEETEGLLRDLDAVMGRIVGDVKAQTIVAAQGQVALCGLEPFVDETSIAPVNGVAKLPKRGVTKWSATELAIRAVLSQVSKTPEGEIERDHSIFHLGLDSISAIKVSSLLRKKDVRITVGEIMKNSSIQEMGALLAQRVDTSAAVETKDVDAVVAASISHIDKTALARDVGVEESDVEDVMPVSAGQLYMLARWEQTGGAQFEANFQYKVDGAVDQERLEKAWEALTKRHAILRTVFSFVEDEGVRAVQIVLKEKSNPVKYAKSTDTAVSVLDPVFLVVEEVEGQKTISLRLLHAVYDGISLQLLIQDLEILYSNPSSALPPPLSFKEFIARDLDDESRKAQRTFWESYLPRTESASVPETSDLTHRVEIFKPSLPIGDIASAARKAGVTVDALLLAAFSKAYDVTRQSASDETVVGLYLANRSATTDLSDLVAPTLNLLPLRIQNSSSGLEEIAGGVQKDLLKLSEVGNVGASLADVYRWTGRSVGVFVNVLKTTSSYGNDGDEKAGEVFAGSLSEVDMLRPRAEVIDIVPKQELLAGFEKRGDLKGAYLVSSSSFIDTPFSRERVLTAYQASVDIELRLVDGGKALDVGLFAPEGIVGLQEGERLIQVLGEVLSRL